MSVINANPPDSAPRTRDSPLKSRRLSMGASSRVSTPQRQGTPGQASQHSHANTKDNAKSNFTKQLAQKLIDHVVDEPGVVAIATQLITDANRKLDFKLSKQLQVKEKDLREEFNAKLKDMEDSLKKEMSLFTLQTSVKKGIDESMLKRSPSFIPSPQPGLDEMQVIKLCKDTFSDEYAKRMVQYHMDLTQEIDEVERAKVLLKNETESNQLGIMQAMSPL